MSKKLNGIDIDQLLATVNAIKENPEIARFQFRSETEWVNGGQSRSRVQGFFGAGTEDASRKEPFIIGGDEPPVLLGSNTGPNAVEAILASIGSCLAVAFQMKSVPATRTSISAIRSIAMPIEKR